MGDFETEGHWSDPRSAEDDIAAARAGRPGFGVAGNRFASPQVVWDIARILDAADQATEQQGGTAPEGTDLTAKE